MRQSTRRGIWMGALLLAGVILPPRASAADGPPATAAEREAQVRFEEGLARVKAGNFEGARMSFTQAYAVLRKPPILWNLALAEEKSGHAVDALGHFKIFARVTTSSEDRASAEKHIAELGAQLGRLDVAADAGAQIVIDGVTAGVAPLSDPVDVAPGHHHVEVRGPDSREADAEVGAGQITHVFLVPVPPSGLSSTTTGTAATSPVLPPLTKPEEVRSGGEPPPSAAQEASTARVLTVLGIGTLAAASVALGAYFALQSQSESSTSARFHSAYGDAGCFGMPGSTPCAQWNDAVNAQNRDAVLSNGFYIGGGVLAAAALTTWLLWPRTRGAARAIVWGPTVGERVAGFSATARF